MFAAWLPIRSWAYKSAPDGATWRSGYAAVCKTVYTSSILVVASILTPRNSRSDSFGFVPLRTGGAAPPPVNDEPDPLTCYQKAMAAIEAAAVKDPDNAEV